MRNSNEFTLYKMFGLIVDSDILLPEVACCGVNHSPDIYIRRTNLTSILNSQIVNSDHFIIEDNSVLFHAPHIAVFLIEDGNRISYFPLSDSLEDYLALYIMGTCMGAILLQRKILPLHGSAVAIDGKAYAIVGDSGAGKSTLASAFLNKGYQLLSDDVIPVSFSDEGVPMVTPAYPQQKLWQESLDQFEMEANNFQPIFNRETKFKIPVEDKFADEPLPLAGIIELSKTEENQIKFEPIQNLERLSTLYKHTYRNFIIPRAGLTEWHFQTSAKIISQIEMHKLQRPVSTFSAHELTDVILSSIHKEANVI